ncbi:MAG: hypothetical protein JOZ90_01910 [Alphaproteobacteria bacterium]|nr:hypothetical protein [Alphaproteobacteria bacterium]MBV9370759.1 hypothetical protein [Alphaproteobacteria bacterium]MBV9899832.1 hypothetical protein [Alphaproteobacteria bacterium]
MAKSKRGSRLWSALDPAVAALAAASAAFLVFAMPEPLFSGLVVRSGLPNILAAAQPPLGDTARLAVVAAAALFVFAFVWSLLRALGSAPAAAAAAAADAASEAEDESDAQPGLLRLRRADAHPDAPARRPILAGRELGEPLDILDLPPPEAPAAEPAPAPIVEVADRPSPVAPFLVPQQPADEEPVADSAPPAAPAGEDEAGPAPSDAAPAPAPVPLPAEAAEAPEPAADLSGLMERFESGLGRKRQAIVRHAAPAAEPARVAPSAPAPEEASDRVGHRLRSAIAELQKVAGQPG